MAANNINRSKLFKVAHAIFAAGEAPTFGAALRQAWKVVRLLAVLAVGKAVFCYRKVNGEVREAVGTLANIAYASKGKGNGAHEYDVIRYFDTQRNSFRSFRAAYLIW